jgi:hypothetical protein
MTTTVRVFRNLTAGPRGSVPVYSIQARIPGAGWRTVAHASHVCLRDAEFRVSASGVDRIRRTGKKTVVAVIQGTLTHWSGELRRGTALMEYRIAQADCPEPANEAPFRAVRFNPFKMATFQDEIGAPVLRARSAWVGAPGVVASKGA